MSKKYCPIHGVYSGGRCSGCNSMRQKEYNRMHRDKEMDKFYNSSAWRRLRARHIRINSLCTVCNRPGEIVDHIKEIRDGGCKLCEDNLQTLCISCHNKKTAMARRGRV